MGAGLLVLCDQPKQQPFLECAGDVQVSDLRFVRLSIAIDAAIALLKPVRVVRQVEMDQMETSLLQVQTFGERVGADQDDAVLFGTALRDPCALGFGIDAADCQHLAVDRARAPQHLKRRQLAVRVFRVDQDVRARIFASD